MSFHTDFEKWKEQSKKENCPVCNDEEMPEGMEDLYEAEYTWLNAEPIECIKGACHVTAKFHEIELYDLSDEQLLGFMKEVQVYAEALKKVTDAIKINYEIQEIHYLTFIYIYIRDTETILSLDNLLITMTNLISMMKVNLKNLLRI